MVMKVVLFPLLFVISLSASPSDSVTLQLKWWHQFQFAGYYAAQLKGYYAQQGLAVKLEEGDSNHPPVEQVLSGKAQFGISGSDLVINYVNGEPVVALGAIFQHSPYVILSDNSKNIHSPVDLIGKTVMASEAQGWVQVEAMLLKEGIPPGSVNIIKHSWNINDLSNGKADAQTAYISVEPNQLRQKGIQPSVLNPENYGIDFYGDVLFTTQQEIEEHPGTVEKFRKASFLGWQYAMQHPSEIIDYILTLPGVKERGLTRELLLAEYSEMNKLILPGLIETGHMNEGRWEHILDTYKSLKLTPASASIDGFVYDEGKTESSRFIKLILYAGILIALVLLLFIANFYRLRNIRIATQLKLKKSEEHLELAVDAAGLGIWDWDIKNDTLFLNSTWKMMLGYAPDEIKEDPRTFLTLIHPEDKELFAKKLNEHIIGLSENFSSVFRMQTKSGKWKWILSQSKAERNKDRIATRLAGIHLDMDDLKKKEQELHRITEDLLRMNTDLQQFAFVTSHNLRAPVANITSLLRMADYSQLSEINKDIHGKIQFSTNMLMNTLQDLNDILTAKKETEKPKELINIRERFASLSAIFNDDIKKTGSHLTTDFSAVQSVLFPVTIFDSIVMNLLSNALKFRNPKRVLEITITSGEDNQYIFLKFKDNGKGIDLALQGNKIFKLYQRFHELTEGKGMGLYIIKNQLENLGGKITVASVPDEGAEFTIWIRKEINN
jgi:PAS domain S-box-containing protein